MTSRRLTILLLAVILSCAVGCMSSWITLCHKDNPIKTPTSVQEHLKHVASESAAGLSNLDLD